MSYCCVCGYPKKFKVEDYDEYVHCGLALLRQFDHRKICPGCVILLNNQDPMVLHTQLPLPRKKYGIAKGVFATKNYFSHVVVCEYTGRRIKYKEAKGSKSEYIVNAFVGKVPREDRRYIDGVDCEGAHCFVYFFYLF